MKNKGMQLTEEANFEDVETVSRATLGSVSWRWQGHMKEEPESLHHPGGESPPSGIVGLNGDIPAPQKIPKIVRPSDFRLVCPVFLRLNSRSLSWYLWEGSPILCSCLTALATYNGEWEPSVEGDPWNLWRWDPSKLETQRMWATPLCPDTLACRAGGVSG